MFSITAPVKLLPVLFAVRVTVSDGGVNVQPVLEGVMVKLPLARLAKLYDPSAALVLVAPPVSPTVTPEEQALAGSLIVPEILSVPAAGTASS